MQQTLFEPTESDLVKIAMARPLEEKIKDAISLLKLYEKQALGMSETGYHLAYSGGKDSDVILELAKMAGIKYKSIYNVTTIDPPELVRYIKKEHPETIFDRPKHSFLYEFENRTSGPPTRIMRWCCEIFKEGSGKNVVKIIGVRAAESPRRAALWKQVKPDTRNKGVFVCPILYWTDADVWNFHKIQGINHCCLYDEGFKRLGCVGCPMTTPKQQTIEFARWPRYEKLWMLGHERFWNKWYGVPTKKGERRTFERFGCWQNMYKWWRSRLNKNYDDSSQCQFGFMQT